MNKQTLPHMGNATPVVGVPQSVTSQEPAWTDADRIIDITDIWQEVMDPENERGEVCMAYLHRDRPGDESERFELRGISISDGTPIYWNREKTLFVLGYDEVCRAEDLEWEATGHEYTDWPEWSEY
jgi:hypothetical protein